MVADAKKIVPLGAPRVLAIDEIDLRATMEGAFRVLEGTTLVIDCILDALQEAVELAKLASRSDGRAKHGLIVHRYNQLLNLIEHKRAELAAAPAAAGNAALAMTLAQTGMSDGDLAFDLPETLGATPAEARAAMGALNEALRTTMLHAACFRDTARRLLDHGFTPPRERLSA